MVSPEKPRPWTKEQYAEWLADIAARLEMFVEQQRPWPKGAKRFEYLYVDSLVKAAWERIDPVFRQRRTEFENPADAHHPNEPDPKHKGRVIARSEQPVTPAKDAPPTWLEQFKASYADPFREGDVEAIFEFASDSYEALREPWVIEQLVQWRREGSDDAQRQFDRFMQAYWKPAGRRSGDYTLPVIRRDQEIFIAYLNRDLSSSVAAFVERHANVGPSRVGDSSIRRVIAKYGAHFDEWSTGALRPY